MKKSFVFVLIAILAIGLFVSCQPDQEVKQVKRLVFFDEGTRVAHFDPGTGTESGGSDLFDADMSFTASDYDWYFRVSDGEYYSEWQIITFEEEAEDGTFNNTGDVIKLNGGPLYVGETYTFKVYGFKDGESLLDNLNNESLFSTTIAGALFSGEAETIAYTTTSVEIEVSTTDYFYSGDGFLGFKSFSYKPGIASDLTGKKVIVEVTSGTNKGYALSGEYSSSDSAFILNTNPNPYTLWDDGDSDESDNTNCLTDFIAQKLSNAASSAEGTGRATFSASETTQRIGLNIWVYDEDGSIYSTVYPTGDKTTDTENYDSSNKYTRLAYCDSIDKEIYIFKDVTTLLTMSITGTGEITPEEAVEKIVFAITYDSNSSLASDIDPVPAYDSIPASYVSDDDSTTEVEEGITAANDGTSVTITINPTAAFKGSKYADCYIALESIDGEIFRDEEEVYYSFIVSSDGTIRNALKIAELDGTSNINISQGEYKDVFDLLTTGPHVLKFIVSNTVDADAIDLDSAQVGGYLTVSVEVTGPVEG